MECSVGIKLKIEAEFWGVEVKSATPLKVTPEIGRAVHISQVALGKAKKKRIGSIEVQVKVKIDGDDDSTMVLGTLSAEKPQFSCQSVLSKTFELSHDWPYGSVYLLGNTLDAYAFYRKRKSPESPKKIGYDDYGSDDSRYDSDDDVAVFVENFDSEDDSTDDEEITRKERPVSAPQNTVLVSPTHPNKKRRLMVSPCRFFEENGFASANVIGSLHRGLTRVEALLSELPDFSKDSRKLEADFKELLRMISRPVHIVSQRKRFYELLKQVLELWELVENQIEQQQLWRVPQLVMALGDYAEPVPSAWVVMSDWHDLAYKEILSIRDKHSCLLDHAYEKKNGFKSNEVLLCKKSLNFLASSKEEISSLTKDKCYKWVMNIKSFVSREKFMVYRNLTKQPEEWNFMGQSKSNWRDKIYEKIVDSRKKHSRYLDEAYNSIYDLETYVANDDAAECLDFLDKSLEFLGKCRADLVFVSKKDCRKQLKEIKRFVKESPKSAPANKFWNVQYEEGYWEFLTEPEHPLVNWRDVAYEKLQPKMDKFMFLILDEYKKQKEKWSKEPLLVKSMEQYIIGALELYGRRRPGMSLLSSMDEYFELVDNVSGHLYKIKDLFKELQGGSGKEAEWDPLELIPKEAKLSHLYNKSA